MTSPYSADASGSSRRRPWLAGFILDLALRGRGAEAVRGDIEERWASSRSTSGSGPTSGTSGSYWREAGASLLAWWRPSAIRERRLASRRAPFSAPGGPRSAGNTSPRFGSSLLQDVRFALRSLSARPGFASVIVIALGLGIGATTTIYCIVDGVLLRPLPYADAARLVGVGTTSERFHTSPLANEADAYRMMGVAMGNFADWRERAETLDALVAAEWRSFDVQTDDGPEQVSGAAVTRGFFEMLGVRPTLSRLFDASEHTEGAERIAVLSHGAWQKRYGGDVDVVGQDLETTTGSYQIVGVLPAEFRPPEAMSLINTSIWVPIAENSPDYANREGRSLVVMGRLAPGITLTAARQELWNLADRIADEVPEGNVHPDGTQFGAGANSLLTATVGSVSEILLPLQGAVGLLLLIACANVANLYLAQGIARQRELAVRSALGAGRWRLVRQLLTESVLLAGLGGAVGLALAQAGLRAFVTLSPPGTPRIGELSIDLNVLLFAIAVSTATGVAFGLYPALHLSRTHTGEALEEGLRVTGTPARRRFRNLLVITEAALAVILSVGAGLMFSSMLRLTAVDTGFDATGVTTLRVQAAGGFEQADPDVTFDFQRRLLEQFETIPGAAVVATGSNVPMQPTNWRAGVLFDGETVADGRGVNSFVVSPGFFDALRIPMLDGRMLNDGDQAGGPTTVVVNRAFVEEFGDKLASKGGVGSLFRMSGTEDSLEQIEIVGVVENMRQEQLAAEPVPEIYTSAQQTAWPLLNVLVRMEPGATLDVASARRLVSRVDPNVPLTRYATLSDRIRASVVEPRFYSALMSGFAAVALLLAASGIYATTLFAVRSRTREVGIRIALGARTSGVRRMLVRQGMMPTVVGCAIGLLSAIPLSRLVDRFLFSTEATDLTTLTWTATLFLATAMAACWLPARRASELDVQTALRAE